MGHHSTLPICYLPTTYPLGHHVLLCDRCVEGHIDGTVSELAVHAGAGAGAAELSAGNLYVPERGDDVVRRLTDAKRSNQLRRVRVVEGPE